jgi:hypothetical protein
MERDLFELLSDMQAFARAFMQNDIDPQTACKLFALISERAEKLQDRMVIRYPSGVLTGDN